MQVYRYCSNKIWARTPDPEPDYHEQNVLLARADYDFPLAAPRYHIFRHPVCYLQLKPTVDLKGRNSQARTTFYRGI
jgi:hypothetical protein